MLGLPVNFEISDIPPGFTLVGTLPFCIEEWVYLRRGGWQKWVIWKAEHFPVTLVHHFSMFVRIEIS